MLHWIFASFKVNLLEGYDGYLIKKPRGSQQKGPSGGSDEVLFLTVTQ